MTIDRFPPDDFNVEIQNNEDRACLLWLVNQVGEVKLRASVAKYEARWLGSKPFVWTLLRWYRLKVPRDVYAPVQVPVYWLYVLCRLDGTEVKIGMTGQWPSRVNAFALPYRAVGEVFDLYRSRAFLVGGSKAEVVYREKVIKKRFAPWRVDERSREWFDGVVTNDVLAAAAAFDDENKRVTQTLCEAIAIQAEAGLESPRSPDLAERADRHRITLQ